MNSQACVYPGSALDGSPTSPEAARLKDSRQELQDLRSGAELDPARLGVSQGGSELMELVGMSQGSKGLWRTSSGVIRRASDETNTSGFEAQAFKSGG